MLPTSVPKMACPKCGEGLSFLSLEKERGGGRLECSSCGYFLSLRPKRTGGSLLPYWPDKDDTPLWARKIIMRFFHERHVEIGAAKGGQRHGTSVPW